MKHAYLVMAHHQFDILITQIKLLDDENNHFYIHIDKKSKDVPFDEIKKSAKYSKIYFCERISVNWGGYSVIECELLLLKSAIREKYDYYHLVSGVDLPIKKKEQIFNFFEEHRNYQYIHFERPKIQNRYLDRIKFFYIFQEYAHNNRLFYYLGVLFEKLQRRMGINRIKNLDEEIQFGSNWFSITHSFALLIIEKEKWIQTIFKKGKCVDEMFVQTILINSKYKSMLPKEPFSGAYKNCLRHIDWKRGAPYCFRKCDFEELINSECLFARKFDINIDNEIISMLYCYLISK